MELGTEIEIGTKYNYSQPNAFLFFHELSLYHLIEEYALHSVMASKMAKFTIDTALRMNSGYEIPALGYGVRLPPPRRSTLLGYHKLIMDRFIKCESIATPFPVLETG